MSIIYEVNLSIQPEIYEKFMSWLKEHVKDMVKFKGFIEGNILVENCEALTDIKKVTVAYLIHHMNDLDTYIKEHAPTMRKDGIDKFGDKFSATRRIFKIDHSIKKSCQDIADEQTLGLM